MNLQLQLLALLAAGWSKAIAAPLSTNADSTNRTLVIDSSSMPIAAGKVTLIIGALQRTNGVYAGDYKIKVAPYFYKNEKGRLAIAVSDESMTLLGQGKTAMVDGTATTSGKSGKTRHVDATAMPADINHGKLKLSFISGDKKMIFEPAYHFAEKETTTASAHTTKINLSPNLQRSPPASHGEALETAAKLP